ncbi:hypothetical protein N1851_028000 [Merluccius polli]|uniref:Uncharacterized protein n=1 Tax=Merluccius polli TaxID=89951 RepID=A0AA47NRW1_MERPO|nr:hypothetical protein N1851_028000 [Merluccius polli]
MKRKEKLTIWIGVQKWMGNNDQDEQRCDESLESHHLIIGPDDNMSQKASSKVFSKATSKASSASSACLKVKAECAALRAKAQALEMKHALDMEEAQRKARK